MITLLLAALLSSQPAHEELAFTEAKQRLQELIRRGASQDDIDLQRLNLRIIEVRKGLREKAAISH